MEIILYCLQGNDGSALRKKKLIFLLDPLCLVHTLTCMMKTVIFNETILANCQVE